MLLIFTTLILLNLAIPQDKDESGVLNVSAASNSLNLVLRDEGLMKFVKYVGAQVCCRWIVGGVHNACAVVSSIVASGFSSATMR